VKSYFKSHLIAVLGTAVLLGLVWRPALAHHGTANVYDNSKAVEMKGTIVMFEWTNPHNQIHFDVADATGKVTRWIAATEPPQVMLERGWTRRSLKAGDQVTAYVFVAKNGAPVGNLQRIVMADGKQLGTGGGGAPPPAAAPAAPPPTK
jgi:uncharacterized protein DUF6152